MERSIYVERVDIDKKESIYDDDECLIQIQN